MSQLDEILALAANNTAGEFALSGDSLAVLFFAADWLANLNNWRDFDEEPLSDADIDTIQALVDNTIDQLMRPIMAYPVGSTMTWHTATPPAKWLICNGQSVLKADYPELFALWGTKYGGDATHFSLLDMKDRSPMGADTIALDAAAGASTHTLATGEIPSHNHGVTDPTHVHSGVVVAQTQVPARAVVSAGGAQNVTMLGTSNANSTGISINNTGGGGSHNNLHPVKGVHWIVYAGA